MTALPPMENRRVRGVATKRYDINPRCGHPECDEETADPHHIFPRSLLGSDSWWVRIGTDEEEPAYTDEEWAIPHVIGLCRKHHDDVEEHRSWIKFNEEARNGHGEFVWWDHRRDPVKHRRVWVEVGPLEPQPWGWTDTPRKKRARKKGTERRQRRVWSISVPLDELENEGSGLLDDLVEQLEEKRSPGDHRSPYYTLVDALNFTVLNAGPDDFA